jgi:hypothetical protein
VLVVYTRDPSLYRFVANVSTVVLNKAIYVYLDFKYPFTLTAVHMAVNRCAVLHS